MRHFVFRWFVTAFAVFVAAPIVGIDYTGIGCLLGHERDEQLLCCFHCEIADCSFARRPGQGRIAAASRDP